MVKIVETPQGRIVGLTFPKPEQAPKPKPTTNNPKR